MAMLNNQRVIVFYKSIFLSIYLSTYIYIYHNIYIYIHIWCHLWLLHSQLSWGKIFMNCYQCFIFQTGSSKINHRPGPCPSDFRAPKLAHLILIWIKAHGEGAILHLIWRDPVQSWRDLSAQSATSQRRSRRAKGSRSGFPTCDFVQSISKKHEIPIPKRNAVANNSSMGNSGP